MKRWSWWNTLWPLNPLKTFILFSELNTPTIRTLFLQWTSHLCSLETVKGNGMSQCPRVIMNTGHQKLKNAPWADSSNIFEERRHLNASTGLVLTLCLSSYIVNVRKKIGNVQRAFLELIQLDYVWRAKITVSPLSFVRISILPIKGSLNSLEIFVLVVWIKVQSNRNALGQKRLYSKKKQRSNPLMIYLIGLWVSFSSWLLPTL